MLTTIFTGYVAVAHSLGAYNIGRFVLKTAVRKRRERKAQAARDAKVDDIVDDLSALRDRIYSGKLNADHVKAVRDMVQAALDTPAEPAK